VDALGIDETEYWLAAVLLAAALFLYVCVVVTDGGTIFLLLYLHAIAVHILPFRQRGRVLRGAVIARRRERFAELLQSS
jgi:hypothetical protein